MPKSWMKFIGREGWVYGWGTTQMGGNASHILRCISKNLNIAGVQSPFNSFFRETTQTVINKRKCSRLKGTWEGEEVSMANKSLSFSFTSFIISCWTVPRFFLKWFLRVTDDMLCGIASGKDACQGDSGGPFTIQVILAIGKDKGMKVVINDQKSSGARSPSPGWSCQLGLWMCSGEGCDAFVR